MSSYLDSRQHDSDQVVVREQQGTNNTAVTHMLDDGCEEGRPTECKSVQGRRGEYAELQWAHRHQALRLNLLVCLDVTAENIG